MNLNLQIWEIIITLIIVILSRLHKITSLSMWHCAFNTFIITVIIVVFWKDIITFLNLRLSSRFQPTILSRLYWLENFHWSYPVPLMQFVPLVHNHRQYGLDEYLDPVVVLLVQEELLLKLVVFFNKTYSLIIYYDILTYM